MRGVLVLSLLLPDLTRLSANLVRQGAEPRDGRQFIGLGQRVKRGRDRYGAMLTLKVHGDTIRTVMFHDMLSVLEPERRAVQHIRVVEFHHHGLDNLCHVPYLLIIIRPNNPMRIMRGFLALEANTIYAGIMRNTLSNRLGCFLSSVRYCEGGMRERSSF